MLAHRRPSEPCEHIGANVRPSTHAWYSAYVVGCLPVRGGIGCGATNRARTRCIAYACRFLDIPLVFVATRSHHIADPSLAKLPDLVDGGSVPSITWSLILWTRSVCCLPAQTGNDLVLRLRLCLQLPLHNHSTRRLCTMELPALSFAVRPPVRVTLHSVPMARHLPYVIPSAPVLRVCCRDRGRRDCGLRRDL